MYVHYQSCPACHILGQAAACCCPEYHHGQQHAIRTVATATDLLWKYAADRQSLTAFPIFAATAATKDPQTCYIALVLHQTVCSCSCHHRCAQQIKCPYTSFLFLIRVQLIITLRSMRFMYCSLLVVLLPHGAHITLRLQLLAF